MQCGPGRVRKGEEKFLKQHILPTYPFRPLYVLNLETDENPIVSNEENIRKVRGKEEIILLPVAILQLLLLLIQI